MPRFHAQLMDTEEAPLADVDVRVIGWSMTGSLELVAEGKTEPDGNIGLQIVLGASFKLFPYLVLQLLRDDVWIDLADSPIELSEELIELGVLVVAPEPAMMLGDRKLYALHQSAYAIFREAARNKAKLLEAQAQQALLKAKVMDLEAQRESLNEERLTLINNVKTLNGAVSSLKDNEKTLMGQIKGLQEQLAHSDPQPSDSKGTTPIVDIVKNVGAQLGTAAKALSEARGGMVLGDVSISLKGVSDGSGQMEFPSVQQIQTLGGGQISSLEMSFHPQIARIDGPTKPSSSDPGMPNLLGYTEIIARRKLEPLEVVVEVSHKAVAKPDAGPSPWGRVVEQSPAPGGSIEPGDRVEILIGKPIEGALQGKDPGYAEEIK